MGDIRDRDHLSRTVEEHGVTGIVHLAAMVAAAAERDIPRAVEVNVGGSVNVSKPRSGTGSSAWRGQVRSTCSGRARSPRTA